jgi:Arc/MetJ-type ribon-helix-helix transcriptional regulator
MARFTVMFDDDQLDEVRQLVAAGHVANVSAFVRRAVEVALNDPAAWRRTLDSALQETGGPLSAKERAWADALLSRPTHRILRSSRTGTITHSKALRAMRAAKKAMLAGTLPKVPRVADIYGFGFAPAMGDRKGAAPVRLRKPAVKDSTKKRAAGRAH